MHTLVRMPIKLQQPVPPSPVTATVTARFISIWKYRTFEDHDSINNPNRARNGRMISQHPNNERKMSLFLWYLKKWPSGPRNASFLSFYILMSTCMSASSSINSCKCSAERATEAGDSSVCCYPLVDRYELTQRMSWFQTVTAAWASYRYA